MTHETLFDAGPRLSRHGTSRALVHIPTGVGLPCPGCGWPVEGETTSRDALFFHGGYGASMVTVSLFCVRPNPDPWEPDGCGWSIVKDQSELRPPKYRWVGW